MTARRAEQAGALAMITLVSLVLARVITGWPGTAISAVALPAALTVLLRPWDQARWRLLLRGSVRLAVWDNATQATEADVVEIRPGERLIFGDHYYSVALYAAEPPVTHRPIHRHKPGDPPAAWPDWEGPEWEDPWPGWEATL